MRHNQNGRRFRGRSNNGQGHQGHQSHGHHHHNGGGNNYQRRVNPRTQTFDSNGPDVRIRGNPYQINEKYVTLARDASSAGDRVLAESYLQHAEHYQRMINELAEEYNKFNPPQAQQYQQPITGEEPQPVLETTSTAPQQQAQPDDTLNDLDQGFLRGPRNIPVDQPGGSDEQPPMRRQTERV
jgi:hypothetical protein